MGLQYDDGVEPKPLDIFMDAAKLDDLRQLVIPQSVLYMQQQGHVFAIEVEELNVFIETTAFMEYHIVPTLHDYWSQDPGLGIAVVANVMSRDRFLEERRALHFVNYDKLHDEQDNAWKVRPIINHFNSSFIQAMLPSSHEEVDEHMIKFKGHHTMKQYMPMKPMKRGFKMWCRNDSETNYLFQFDLHTGWKETKKEVLEKMW